MRKDFNRVLTEDPRYGSNKKFREYRNAKGNAVFDEEFSGGKESMMMRRRIAKGERKSFGDHLSPLRGWVAKQVGKKWDDVYSEVCALFDRRSFIKAHVHQHLLRDFVELNTKYIDGKVCTLSRWNGWREIGSSKYDEFYVHPVTGILCTAREDKEAGHAAKAEAARAAELAEVFRVHNRNTHLYFENGQWWLYFLTDIPQPYWEYRCPSWWTNAERERWKTMTLTEREREGQLLFVRPAFNPIRPPAVAAPYGSRAWFARSMCPENRYYCAKRVASRKILKGHGLAGTAEFVENTRTHREMSKYR